MARTALPGIFSFLAACSLFGSWFPMTAKRIFAATLSFIVCLSASLRGDTVTLKSGDKVEGKILSETDAEVTMSVQVTATIKDERVIKRDEIAKIDKVQPDEQAWALIANLAPGTESLERDEYDKVKAALGYFTGTFPKSAHAALAQSRLHQFTAEQIRVGLGEVKLNGQWLGKERVKDEQVQIAGRILLNRMKRAAGAGQMTEAMAIFDQLEKGFAGSASYPEAVELGRGVLASLFRAVAQRQVQFKRHLDDEKQRVAGSKGTELAQLNALIKQDLATTEATLAAIERSGVKWFPLQPANARSLASLASRVTSETARLNGLPIDKMKESVKIAEAAAAALSNGNFDLSETMLREANAAWSTNELAKRTQLKLADARKAATAPKTATPTPAPASAPTPAPKKKSASASAPAPSSNPATPGDPEQPGETSLFRKPGFFIAVAAVLALGTIGGKIIVKARAAGVAARDAKR